MVGRRTKLRVRRGFRKRQRQAKEFGVTTEDTLDRYIFRRLMRLVEVRRFVLGWFGLIIVLSIGVVLQSRALSSHYLSVQPAPGGTFREGIIGTFTNANPLYAQTEVDAAAARLVFSGLFSHDGKGELVPDLAERYEVDPTETVYTVKLKPNLRWHDGQPLTSKDVVFTYASIQNPETKSFLLNSWRDVTVKAVDEYTVTFTLSNSLSSFPHSLTNGIIPEHKLASVEPTQLRSSSFNNQQPIGSGPFSFEAVEVDESLERGNTRVAFEANPNYHGGSPKLDRLIIRTYKNQENLSKALKNAEVDAAIGLDMPPEDINQDTVRSYYIPMAGEVMVFLKNSNEVLADVNVRRALVWGVDRNEVLGSLPYPVLAVDGPLLKSHIGYNPAYAQETNKKAEAAKILDDNGWLRDPETGVRSKNGVKLTFRLYSSANSEFTTVSGNIQKQWRDLGAEVEVVLQPEEELQSTVSGHNYDALLYGISLGADPDVYAYWHSTQGDVRSPTRLNFSEYKSTVADKALEAGRTRSDAQNRAVKYRPFLEAWKNDAPALALYQPQFLYITSDDLSGFEYGVAQTSSDRYSTVTNWQIRKTPQKIQ